MFRMWAKRISQLGIGPGTDRVLWGVSLPSDTVIHDITARVQLATGGLINGTTDILAYAAEAWILPVLDPDAGATFDAIFDALVPKDTDVQTIDLDTVAADATPFYEPGEADWSKALDIGLIPEKLWHRHRFLTSASPMSVVFKDTETPFDPQWIARDNFTMHIGRRLRVRQPSVLVMAFASPSMDDTTTTVPTALLEDEWGRVKYAEEMLKQAHMDLIGLTEGGAETPWEEATDLLQRHLMPDMFEPSADVFDAATYQVVTEAVIDHSVVGELGKAQLSIS